MHLSVAGPVGPETATGGIGYYAPVVAADAHGDYVVVWQGWKDSSSEIFAQRYDSSGSPVGNQIQVNTTTAGNQENPSVAMNADGDFVVAWDCLDQVGTGYTVYAQRFTAAGEPQEAEFRVNTSTGRQWYPTVAMAPDGDFVVAWKDWWADKVCVQRYDSDGDPLGGELLVASNASGYAPGLAMAPDGAFMVTWESRGDYYDYDTYAQWFDAAGTPQSQFRVNTSTQGSQQEPMIAADSGGNYTVVWASDGQDGSNGGIYGQRYDAAGKPLGNEFRVNTFTEGRQYRPAISALGDGGFAVTWNSLWQDGSHTGIYGQRFDASGTPQGPEFRVNTITQGSQYSSHVAGLGDGFVVTWVTEAPNYPSPYVHKLQRYRVADVSPAIISGRVWNDANGNGLQDVEEAGQEGVKVSLFSAEGAFVASTTTSGAGVYQFDYVSPGVPVYVQMDRPRGYAFAAQNSGDKDVADSDVDPATGRSAIFVPVAGQTMVPVDAGIVQLPTVSGTVYLDEDGNGLRSANERGLNGWFVYADLNQNGQLDAAEPSAISGEDGSYSLSVASPGMYTIQLVGQDLWTPVPTRAITLDARQVILGLDWGNRTTVPTTTVGAFHPQALLGTDIPQAIAMMPTGESILVREGKSLTSQQYGLLAQRYDAAGMRVGDEILVSTSLYYGSQPAVAYDAAGGFVVVWKNTRTGSGSILARRFSATGEALGNEIQVSLLGKQSDAPSVAMDADGDFVVAWRGIGTGWDLWARRYNAAGEPQGDPFNVANRTAGDEQYASVGMDAAGNFVITWESWFKDGTDHCIEARRFNSAGQPLGDEFRVSGQSPGNQFTPTLAMDRNGDFVISWESERQDGSGWGIYAQRYNAAGIPQGSEFRVNTTTAGDQRYQAIAKNPEGGFVIAWQSMGQDGSSWGIYAQRYNSAGLPQGGEFQVNTLTTNDQTDPSVAIDAAGNFLVTWKDYQPNSNYTTNLYAQRYQVGLNSGSISGRAWADKNGNAIQDSAEASRSGITVNLFSTSNTLLGTTLTSSDGTYRFCGIVPDEPVYVEFVLPARTSEIFTRQDVGDNERLDSDVSPVTGRTPLLTLSAGEQRVIDAGLTYPGTVSGTLYQDANGNGVRDAGEALLAGWTVYVDANQNGALDAGETTALTNSKGAYSIAGLIPGPTLIAQVDQHLWAMAQPRLVNLAPSITTSGIDFGNRALANDRYMSAIGPVLTVSTDATSTKRDPVMAMASNGDFVLAWVSTGQDGDQDGIYAQLYDAAGQRRGEEFRVNSTTIGSQTGPAVAMNAHGDFVIVWQGFAADGPPQIYAQRYNAAGQPQGTEFRVNTAAAAPDSPAVAMDASGAFVITWNGRVASSYQVYAQRYNVAGEAQGDEWRVSDLASGDCVLPAIAMNADGEFVVAWQNRQDYSHHFIWAQRYQADARPLGSAIQMNTVINTSMQFPVVAVNDAGDFVVAWQANTNTTRAQRCDWAGVLQGGEMTLPGTYSGQKPAVAIDASGGTLITWPGNGVINVQRFNGAGLPEGSSFSPATSNSASPAVAMTPAGDFAVAWVFSSGTTQSIRAQRYTVTAQWASVGGRVWIDANDNGIQDPDEAGRAGAGVNLYLRGRFLRSTTTTADGFYRFDKLAPDEMYQVGCSWGGALVMSKQDQGPDDTKDSDFDPTTGKSVPFTLADGQVDLTKDAGYVLLGTISGRVFHDLNGDGQCQSDEPGLQGWTAYLDLNANGQLDSEEPSSLSDANGGYTFSQLRPASYQVGMISQEYWTQTTPASMLLATVPSHAQDIDLGNYTSVPNSLAYPTTDEFSVTTITTRTSYSGAVATDNSGNYVVVWDSRRSLDNSSLGIHAQRYNAQGIPQGSLLRVNTITTGNQTIPDVAMDADGDFVVVWHNDAVSSGGNYAQRYNAAGKKQGEQFKLPPTLGGTAHVAMDAEGNFVIVSTGMAEGGKPALYAQRYNSHGGAEGEPFKICDLAGWSADVSLSMNAGGQWAVAVSETNSPARIQRYNADGTANGSVLLTDPSTPTRYASIAMGPNGQFVVGWIAYSGGSPRFQRYDATGLPQGNPLPVDTVAYPQPVNVSMDSDGGFAIVWKRGDNSPEGGSRSIWSQRYNAAGVRQGMPVQVSSTSSGYSDLAMTPAGDQVVVWQSTTTAGLSIIQARNYSVVKGPDPIIGGTAGDDAFTLKRVGDQVWIYQTAQAVGVPAATFPLSELNTLTIRGLAGNNTLNVDCTGGNPVPSGGLIIDGGTLRLTTTGNAASGGFGLTVRNSAAVEVATGLDVSSLILSDTAAVHLSGAAFLRTAQLSIAPQATLDLADNGLIVTTTPESKQEVLMAISNVMKSARGTDGKWLGNGLTSTVAQTNKQTGLAVVLNEKNGKAILASFDGQAVCINDILVKYTWNGDVNLDGVVDAADYFLVDSGYVTQEGQYRNGDLNLDGTVDASDYFMIDSAFIAQTGVLTAEGVPARVVAHDAVVLKAEAAQPLEAASVLEQLFSTKPVL